MQEESELYQIQEIFNFNLSLLDHTQYECNDDGCILKTDCETLIKFFENLIFKIESENAMLKKVSSPDKSILQYLMFGEFKSDLEQVLEKIIYFQNKSFDELVIHYT